MYIITAEKQTSIANIIVNEQNFCDKNRRQLYLIEHKKNEPIVLNLNLNLF